MSRIFSTSLWVAFIAVFVGGGIAANADNAFVVESKSVPPYATGVTVGVYVTNDEAYAGIVLPLEFREVDLGSYIVNSLSLTVQGRVAASGLTDFQDLRYLGIPDSINSCSGPVSNAYSQENPVDFISPDAVMWYGHAITGLFLAGGTDGPPGEGIPSFLLTFDVSGTPGGFEIDTCCLSPAWHFAVITGFFAINPLFTKGVVTIAPCDCACHGDLVCDSTWDIFDVVNAVEEAFREGGSTADLNCPHVSRADVNCDCVVDVFDVVGLVDRAFREGTAPICNPCDTPCS